MRYFSTNRTSVAVTFGEAVLDGQPDDKGLYFPEHIPNLPDGFIERISDTSNSEIAFRVIKPYVGDDISENILAEICSETVEFDFPLVKITDKISALELFHGPTLAFKDVGARFMSRCLQILTRNNSQKTLVVVATSGDTGGAVANAFHNVSGTEVVILYPKGRVSRIQELQLTTIGGNVITLEVRGSFDECQMLAKQALADSELRKAAFLTSANSINIARWLPQQFYYFFAMKQWNGPPPVVCVPSGNFGNLAAGMLARRSGLPVSRFIAACNANDVVPEFLSTGDYKPKPSVQTLSNAMDVSDPSNFVRIKELYGNRIEEMRANMNAASISDGRTADTMRDIFANYGYILDPHGAVGYAALADHLENWPNKQGLFLETAHPIKFDSVEGIIGNNIVIPESLTSLMSKAKQSIEIDVSYPDVKDILLSRV